MLRAVTLGKIRKLQALLRTYLYALSAVVALTVIYHGKIVDHLYTAKSLIESGASQTYYIGDSKYYKHTQNFNRAIECYENDSFGYGAVKPYRGHY